MWTAIDTTLASCASVFLLATYVGRTAQAELLAAAIFPGTPSSTASLGTATPLEPSLIALMAWGAVAWLLDRIRPSASLSGLLCAMGTRAHLINRSASPGRLRTPSASLLVVRIRRVFFLLAPRGRVSSLSRGSVRIYEMRSSWRAPFRRPGTEEAAGANQLCLQLT
jgi:hypothetical protein